MEYEYRGVDRSGKVTIGKLTGNSEGDIRVLLRSKGVRPTSIKQVGLAQRDLFSLFKGNSISITSEELVIFTRQLQVMIGSGVPLVQSLEIFAEQSPTAGVKNLSSSIKLKVSEGSFLWETMQGFPKVFPKLYIALVRAGETSGSLETMLKRLSSYLEDSEKLKKQIKSAMMYPIIVISVGLIVIWAMLTFVIPKFEEMLKSSKQELPGPTQFVLDLSHFFSSNWYWVVGCAGAAIFALLNFLKTNEGQALADRVSIRLPIFGNIVRKGSTARFTRTLGTLLGSGVTLIDALEICKGAIGNKVIEDAVAKAKPEVEAGKTLSSAISRYNVLPAMAIQMVSVGENTGQMDRMLDKVADFYEAEVEIAVQGLTKLIEPLIIVFLGGTVGGLLIAMYLPIFKMAQSAG